MQLISMSHGQGLNLSEDGPDGMCSHCNWDFQKLDTTGNIDVKGFMAYSHCRIRTRIPTRTRNTVLSRNFPLVQIRTLIPRLKHSKIGMDICHWMESCP